MYNRYIPGTNGHFERQTVSLPPQKLPPQEEKAAEPSPCSTIPKTRSQEPNSPDIGDLLLLCIVLLLLLDSNEEDMSTLLITAAAFILLQ